MNVDGMNLMDLVEEMVVREPDASVDQILESAVDFTLSDEVLNEVFNNVSTPSNVMMKVEEARIRRFPRAIRSAKRTKISLLKSIGEFKKNKEYLHTFNSSQANGFAERVFDFDGSVSAIITESIALQYMSSIPSNDFGRPGDSSGLSEKKMAIQNLRSVLKEVSKSMPNEKSLNTSQVGSLVENFDLITSIPYYKKKLMEILKTRRFKTYDYGASRFVKMLSNTELMSVQSRNYENEDDDSTEILRLLLEFTVREVSSKSVMITESFIRGDITYEEYLKEVSEVSDYAFGKWQKSSQ